MLILHNQLLTTPRCPLILPTLPPHTAPGPCFDSSAHYECTATVVLAQRCACGSTAANTLAAVTTNAAPTLPSLRGSVDDQVGPIFGARAHTTVARRWEAPNPGMWLSPSWDDPGAAHAHSTG